MFRSNNVAARIFQRQICTPAPGTSFNCARRFYENIVPSYTIYNVECPDHMLRKFTEDGLYLVSFNRNHQELVVYRPTWVSYSYGGEDIDVEQLPPKYNKFESYFIQLYSVSLTSIGELICKDFFLYIESKKFGLFATSTTQIHDSPAVGGAIQGVPSIEKITFHLLRMEDGVILDERVFHNDYINLAHSSGVFLYDDLLSIVSLRYQRIHILQIRDSGNLVDVRIIGEFCREDDEFFLNSTTQVNPVGSGLQHNQSITENSFLTGMKQRLLSFIFRGICNEEQDPVTRMQYLKKKFYFHFQDYVNLVIWKVQFLDRHHLLIKFGSVDGGVRYPEMLKIILLFLLSITWKLLRLFHFIRIRRRSFIPWSSCSVIFFHAPPANSLIMNFISSHSNNIHASEQLKYSRNKTSNFSQFVKKVLTILPFTCQSLSPSPYFDLTLFRFDEKLISAVDRHRQSTDHPIKFISRRQPNVLKFKIKPGPEAGNTDPLTKKISSFLFHPTLPLALSVQQTLFLQPSVVNIHFRR